MVVGVVVEVVGVVQAEGEVDLEGDVVAVEEEEEHEEVGVVMVEVVNHTVVTI